jgi:hypothetical protein
LTITFWRSIYKRTQDLAGAKEYLLRLRAFMPIFPNVVNA